MKSMKIVIFIIIEPARVESTSRMKLMRKQMRPRRHHHNVDVHNMLAGSSQVDLFNGLPRGNLCTSRCGPAECAGPLGGI